MTQKEITSWFNEQNFEPDTVGGLIAQLLQGVNLNCNIIDHSAKPFVHIVKTLSSGEVLLSTQKPIGYCKRTGDYVYPTDVDGYDAVCPALDENVDLGEFTLPIREEEENPDKFDWDYIKMITR